MQPHPTLKQHLLVLTVIATSLTFAFGLGWAGSHLRVSPWGSLNCGGVSILRQVDRPRGYTIKTLCYSTWARGQRSTVWMGW